MQPTQFAETAGLPAGSSTEGRGGFESGIPLPDQALCGGSTIGSQLFVEVLAKEIGHRGIAVNAIRRGGGIAALFSHEA